VNQDYSEQPKDTIREFNLDWKTEFGRCHMTRFIFEIDCLRRIKRIESRRNIAR